MADSQNWWEGLALPPGASAPEAAPGQTVSPDVAAWWEGLAVPASPVQAPAKVADSRTPSQSKSPQGRMDAIDDRLSAIGTTTPDQRDRISAFDRGLTLGWAPRISAGAQAGLEPLFGVGSQAPDFSQRYSENLDQRRARDTAFDEAHPIESPVIQGAGTVAGAYGLGRVLPRAPATPPSGGPGVFRVGLGSGATGAAGGAAYGAGTDYGTPEEQLAAAGKGAAVGAVAGITGGFAIPPLVSALSFLGSKGKNIVQSFTAGPKLEAAENAALSKALEAAQRDGVTPQQALTTFKAWQEAGAKPEMLPDLFGDNFKSLAKAVANVPGETKEVANAAIKERGLGQYSRVSKDIGSTIDPANYHQAEDVLLGVLKDNARSAYSTAYSAGADLSAMPKSAQYWPQLSTLLNRPVAAQAMKQAADLASIEGRRLGPLTPELTEQANEAVRLGLMDAADVPKGGVARGLSTETMDDFKRGLDSLIENEKNPITGGLTKKGALLSQYKSQVMGLVDKINPEFGAARAQYAGDLETLQALRQGRDFMKMDPEDITKFMSDPEIAQASKEAFRIGSSRSLKDMAGNIQDNRNLAPTLWGKPIIRDRITAMFGDDAKGLQAFQTALEREQRMAMTNPLVSPRAGSQTVPLAQSMADIGQAPAPKEAPGLVGTMAEKGPIKGALSFLGNSIAERAQGVNPGIARELGPMLFSTDPKQNIATLLRMANKATESDAVGRVNKLLLPAYAGAEGGKTRAAIAGLLAGRGNE